MRRIAGHAHLCLPALGLLAGCAHDTPLPLPAQAALAPALIAPDPGHALTIAEVVDRALANNLDLKAARAREPIALAQVRQAGVLPNPVLGGGFLPLLSGAGSVPAWNVALTQDIKSIVTYRSRQRAAQDSARQVAADIVWQEWQVAGQARQTAADLMLGARMRAAAAANLKVLGERNARLEAALAAHTVTLAAIAPDRVALQSARATLDALDQKQLALMHQLDALLGLDPGVVVPLAAQPDLPPFDPAAVRAGLASLPARRPDLVALRMGYAAADQQVRGAILAQFPDLVLGGSASSDSSRVINAGGTGQIGVPVFDRNQGNIAIARATRAQLHADYTARLAAAVGTVSALLAEAEQIQAQLAIARHDLPAAQAAADAAERAFVAGTLDARAASDLLSNRIVKEQDIMALELALTDRQIATDTLIGAGLPRIAEGGQ